MVRGFRSLFLFPFSYFPTRPTEECDSFIKDKSDAAETEDLRLSILDRPVKEELELVV